MHFFCLQADVPITGGAYKKQFTVYKKLMILAYQLSLVHV